MQSKGREGEGCERGAVGEMVGTRAARGIGWGLKGGGGQGSGCEDDVGKGSGGGEGGRGGRWRRGWRR